MNTVKCTCGCQGGCQNCCTGCQFNPCAVTCSSEFIREYGYVYNVTAQTVAADAPVSFRSEGQLSPKIITPSDSAVELNSTGVYLIEFYVNSAAEDEFTVYKNGAPVTGSTYSSQAAGANIGKVIISAQKGDVITLVNTGTTDVVLDAADTTVNASVMIQRLF